MESRRVVKKDQIAEPIALLSGEEALQEQKVKETTGRGVARRICHLTHSRYGCRRGRYPFSW
jgi:hypothetical protein